MQYGFGKPQIIRNGDVWVRIGEDALRTVVFFGVKTPEGIQYGGTGFLVSWEETGVRTPYIVTSGHVAKRLDGDFVIRVNRVDGGAEELTIEHIEWSYHPDSTVDLAAVNFLLPQSRFNANYLQLQTSREREAAACGDPVSTVGLFRLRMGSKKNIPIVHTGFVAALADPGDRVPVRDRTTGQIMESEVYLVEAQTLNGLSGSPVFITRFTRLPFVKTPSKQIPMAFSGYKVFFGMWQGAWDGLPGEILSEDRNFKGGVRVPVGMGVVTPSDKVVELIRDHPTLKGDRDIKMEERRAADAASTDDAFGLVLESEQSTGKGR